MCAAFMLQTAPQQPAVLQCFIYLLDGVHAQHIYHTLNHNNLCFQTTNHLIKQQRKMRTCLVGSMPMRAGAMSSFTFFTAVSTPLPMYALHRSDHGVKLS